MHQSSGGGGGNRKTGRSEISRASLGAPKRRYDGVEKGPSVWKKEWSAFMTNVPMEKEGKGTKLSKSLDLSKAPRQRVVDGTIDDVIEGGVYDGEEEGGDEGDDYEEAVFTAPSFSYLFASPAEKKAERDKRQRDKEALKKKRAMENANTGQAEFDGDSRSKMQRESDEAKMRGINLDAFANRKEKREALRLTKSKTQTEAVEKFKEDAGKGIHERMVSKLPWYQQGPFPLDEVAEKLVAKKAIKKHGRLRQMVAPPVAADGGQPWHLRRKQNRVKRARDAADSEAADNSEDDYNNDAEEEEGHHLKMKDDVTAVVDAEEDGDGDGEVKAWKRMGSYNYLTVHPSWVAARGWKRMLEHKTVTLGQKTYFNDDGEPIHDGMFATSGWLYNKCIDGPVSEPVPGPTLPATYYRHFAPFDGEQMKSEMCAITARTLGLKGPATLPRAPEETAAATSSNLHTADPSKDAAAPIGFDAPDKPLSSKYLRVAKKKARDAAIAEAIAKGEEPPVFEKPVKKVVEVEVKENEEEMPKESAPDATAANGEEKDGEADEDEGSPTFDVDDEIRTKAVNAASGVSRRMTKKAGAKKVNFRLLVEGELRKLIKLAGGSDAAATAAIESERKRFAAMKKDAPAATEEVGGEVKLTCRQKKKADYEARQLKLKESGVIPAVEDTKKDDVAPAATDANASSEVSSSPSDVSDEDGDEENESDSDNSTGAPASSAASTSVKKQAGAAAKKSIKPKKQSAGGKKVPKRDMRGLNKKQKKEKQAQEEEKAARKAAPPVRIQQPLRRGGNQHDKPDPTSKRTERRMQRTMPEIVKGVLPSNSFMSSDALAQLAKKEQPAPVVRAPQPNPVVPKPHSFVAPTHRSSAPQQRFNPKRTTFD